MTIHSRATDDPKGKKKPTKKPGAISYSLRTIMKRGGNPVGEKGGKKSERKTKRDDKEVQDVNMAVGGMVGGGLPATEVIEETVTRTSSEALKINSAYMEVDAGETGTENAGEITDIVDEEVKGNVENDEVIIIAHSNKEGSGVSKAVVGKDHRDNITIWEDALRGFEEKLREAETSKDRETIQHEIELAQLMIKESLLSNAGYMEKSKEKEDKQNVPDGKDTKTMAFDVNEDGGIMDVGETKDLSRETETKVHNVIGYDKTLVVSGNQSVQQSGDRWADMSDDETVAVGNQSDTDKDDEMWQTVSDKKQRKTSKKEKKNKNESDIIVKGTNDNNFLTKQQGLKSGSAQNKINLNHKGKEQAQPSLVSYLETVKGKARTENKHSIRMTTSFTPRSVGYGDYIRVARELLMYAKEFDDKVLMLPWDDKAGLGPINLDDFANVKNVSDKIRQYFYKPAYVNLQQGSPVYGIGIRFSTDMDKYEFYNRWNVQKSVHKQSNKTVYSVNLAPTQKSPTSFIIGIAVGSTEDQDFELLNQRLEEETKIKGIEVSFQNINQVGVTTDFWKIANQKAFDVNPDKLARDHLRTKYRWAPNAIAIYVPNKEAVTIARKIMLHKYGKLADGKEPIWPDGSQMRFLPIKGSPIKNEKTLHIIKKRMAYHISLKVNEVVLDTGMTNIYQTIEAFQGKTFAEIILDQKNDSGDRIFTHFNRGWSSDPSKERWQLATRMNTREDGKKILNNIKDVMYDKFGQDVNQFFTLEDESNSWKHIVASKRNVADDDDDWFDDDEDIEELVKQGIVDSSFLEMFKDKEVGNSDEKDSVVSWGTGKTAYTEIVTNQETAETVNSSLTSDKNNLSEVEKEKRMDIVKVRLLLRGISEQEVDNIMEKKPPYSLAFSGINLPTWDPETEVILIMALRNQHHNSQNINHDE